MNADNDLDHIIAMTGISATLSIRTEGAVGGSGTYGDVDLTFTPTSVMVSYQEVNEYDEFLGAGILELGDSICFMSADETPSRNDKLTIGSAVYDIVMVKPVYYQQTLRYYKLALKLRWSS